MQILVKAFYFLVLIWMLLIMYKIFAGEMHIRLQHQQLQYNRVLLLEASDYYLWKQNQTHPGIISSISPFIFKNASIYVGLKPEGSFCIYRVVLYNNQTRQLFFCLE